MHILMINFNADFTEEQYNKTAVADAPTFANIEGLIMKYMIFNHETKVYGGCYMFESKQALDAYKQGDIYRSIINNPDWTNITASEFEVLDEATEIQERLKSSPAAGDPHH